MSSPIICITPSDAPRIVTIKLPPVPKYELEAFSCTKGADGATRVFYYRTDDDCLPSAVWIVPGTANLKG